MEYKKIEKDNYNLHIINLTRFKTVTIEVNISRPLIEEEISYNRLLSRVMAYSSKKYNTRKKWAIRSEEIYGSTFFGSSSIIGKMSNLTYGVDFINPKYTVNNEWKNNFDLLYEGLFNPNIKNDEFENSSFGIVRDSLLTAIRINNEYPSAVAEKAFEKIMFKGSPASYNRMGEEDIIKEITPKSLYEHYKKIFSNSVINILVYGNFEDTDELYILESIDLLFSSLKIKTAKDLTPQIERKFDNKIKEIKEEKNVTQSQLIMGFNVEGLDEYQSFYPLYIYNTILGGGVNSLLFHKVREENSYCYRIRSGLYKYSKALVVAAGISKKNYDDTVRLVKECIELMNDRKIIESNLENVKKEINTRLNNYYDSQASISDHYFINEFDYEDDVEEQRRKYNEITVDEIIEIGKHISLDTIYFLEGTKVSANE